MAETTVRKSGLTWEEICEDPNLHDLPYKIETNEWGQIVMSPTHVYHGKLQYRIARMLDDHLPQGEVTVETAVRTTKGTKVTDVAWCSPERWEHVKNEYDTSVAPEICVEVLSPTNTDEEIAEKRRLYLAARAEEVWTCDVTGRMRFFTSEGEQEQSTRAPSFPKDVNE